MTHRPSLQMKSESAEMSVSIAVLSKETTQDVTDWGRKMQVGENAMMKYCVFRDPTNYFPDQQAAFLGPEAAELMTQCVISSHVCSAHHAMPLSRMLRSDSAETTTWSLQQRRAPTQVPLRGHLRKREKAEYRLALNQRAHAHTSTHTPEVHCQVLQWLAGLSLQHPSLHSDRVVADCCQDVSVVYRRQSEQTEKPGCLTHKSHK